MRALLVVAAVLSLIAVLVLVTHFVLRDGEPSSGAPAARAASTREHAMPAVPDAGSAPSPTLPLASMEHGEPVRSAIDAGLPEPAGEPGSLAIVIGRVVDVDGAPLADVHLSLVGFRSWAEGHDVPRLSGRIDWHGFETRTGDDGSFRIEAPPPTAQIVALRVEPDHFHDSVRLSFGSSGAESAPRLTAGVRDVGELRLGVTGAISGRVTDTAGGPLADVRITIGSSRTTTLGHETYTEPDGTYLLAHAPLGRYGVNAKLDGHLSHFIESITVEARRETSGVDLALMPAPTLEGRVVDEHGASLADVQLYGWPASGRGGSGAGATSDADGRFVVFLPQEDPYTLSAKLAGYHPWGDEWNHDLAFPPNTRDIRVELRSMAMTRFHVVDAESSAPLERFGLAILADNGSGSGRHISTERRAPPLRDHPGGWAEATARPGIDLYVVAADGYLLAAADVEHDSPDQPTQTVRLQRGATLVGRVLRDGAPVVGAVVQSAPATVSATLVDGVLHPVYGPGADTRRARSAPTDAVGRFEVTGLSTGTHRVRVRADEGAPLVRMPVAVEHGTNDLGDLHMTAGAAVEGAVLLPPAVHPVGLEVTTGGRGEVERAPLDSAGRFRFEGLAATKHTFALASQPGLVAPGASVTVELTAGESRAVTIDATDRGMTEVVLTVLVDGRPAEGVQVDLVEVAAREQAFARLGTCDDEGQVTRFVRACGAAAVKVSLGRGQVIEHPEPLQLMPGERLAVTRAFELAALLLRFPSSVEFPSDGRIRIELEPSDGAGASQSVPLHLKDGALRAGGPGVFTAPTELHLASLPVGRWRLTVEVHHGLPRYETTFDEEGKPRTTMRSQEPMYRASADAILVPGEAATVTLD